MFDFFYPPYCVHCEQQTDQSHPFCSLCQTHFTFIDPRQRCPYCGCENEGVCRPCIRQRRFQVRMAAALEHVGAVRTFVAQVRRGQMTQSALSFLLLQWDRLGWPLPDVVIPVPSRGNFSFVKTFAKQLGCTFVDCIRRQGGDLPQMRLPDEERYKLSAAHFFVKQAELGDKQVLLVDDVIGTGTTLRCIAEALADEYPKRIYALALSVI